MIRRLIKGLAFGTLMLTLAVQTSASFAYTKILETSSAVEHYADGVTHQNIRIFTNEGWINMNVMRVDLRKNVEMTVLMDTVLSKRDTLTNLVKKNNEENKIVAAINSDFFDTNSNSTMGNLVRNNQLLSTSVGYDEFASFNMGLNGLPFIAYINSPNNTFTNGTHTKSITYINKPYLSFSRTIYYDKVFAAKSYGKTLGADILEMLVIDNVIKEVRRNGEPFNMPENGYVLASVGTDIAEVSKNFKVGDTLSINYDVNFKYMDLSIGGGAQLIKEGKIVSTFSQNITGRHPRTGLGISKDRKELILVTIDGRTTSFRGVTQTELANLLIGLGAYEGINLDGGGSTQMVAKSPWTTQIRTLNYPSDQAERRMYTALAIEKKLTETPELRSIKIKLDSDRMLVGADMKIVLEGSDTNYNPVSIPAGEVAWSVTGVNGIFENGRFIPGVVGNGVITASYNGLTATQSIEVKNSGVRLIASPTVIKLDEKQEKTIAISVQTEEGQIIPISSKAVKAVVPPSLGVFNYDNGVFTAGDKSGQGYITIEFDGLKTHIPVGVGIDKQVYYDFESPTAKFESYPASATGSYVEVSTNAKVGKSSGMLTYDFSKSTETRAAYMVFNNPVILPVDTQAIGMWVFGDEGKDHWLRAKINDAKCNSTNLTIARHVDWTGWKYITADLPLEMAAPFELERVYLVETDATRQNSGYILVDQIEAVTGQKITVTLPAEVNRVKRFVDYKLPTGLVGKTSQLSSYIYYDKLTQTVDAFMKNNKFNWFRNAGQYSVSNRNDLTLVRLNNNKGSIRTNDHTQWINLIQFTKNYSSTKPVVFMLSDVYLWNDALELELFVGQLKALTDKGVDVAVVMPTNNKTFGVNRMNGAYLL
ncbi:MAG TPA: hypothetical protein DCS67_09705, partial [Clostridiales bacterium UBA8960]|nr:hypothetical protein [Clostridiales bacterium UBA8960]